MKKIEEIIISKKDTILFRDSLNIPKDVTFGVEIEYEKASVKLVTEDIKKFQSESSLSQWKSTIDLSNSIYNGKKIMNGEVKSPILTDNISTWKELKNILFILKQRNACITNNCGGHVNVGTQILGNNKSYWENFLLLWILYKEEIYNFASGEFKNIRDNSYLNLISNDIKIRDIVNPKQDVLNYIHGLPNCLLDKKHDLSLKKCTRLTYKRNNVIEFRIPNGTLDECIWQNYINFFVKLLLSCKKDLDIDKTLYKIKHNDHNITELVNYVFDSDIDKTNFYIQTEKLNKKYRQKLKRRF